MNKTCGLNNHMERYWTLTDMVGFNQHVVINIAQFRAKTLLSTRNNNASCLRVWELTDQAASLMTGTDRSYTEAFYTARCHIGMTQQIQLRTVTTVWNDTPRVMGYTSHIIWAIIGQLSLNDTISIPELLQTSLMTSETHGQPWAARGSDIHMIHKPRMARHIHCGRNGGFPQQYQYSDSGCT